MTAEVLRHCRQEAEEFHGFLSVEQLQGRVQKLNLSLQLVKVKVGVGIDVRRTISEEVMAIINHRVKSLEVGLQRLKAGHRAIIYTTRARGKGVIRIESRSRRVVAVINRVRNQSYEKDRRCGKGTCTVPCVAGAAGVASSHFKRSSSLACAVANSSSCTMMVYWSLPSVDRVSAWPVIVTWICVRSSSIFAT